MISQNKIPPKPNECEACSREPHEFIYDMWLCKECKIRESDAHTFGYLNGAQEIQIPSRVKNMIDGTIPISSEILTVIDKARKIDHALTTRADLYNAETIAIKELEDSLPIDTPNKPFILAKLVAERINHYKDLIFSQNEELIELHNKQRASQTYLNNLANTLRLEERAQFKLGDLNYKPREVKPIKSPKIPKKLSIDKKELRHACEVLSIELRKPIPEFMLQMICVSKGCTVAEGVNFLRRQLNEAISETN